MKIKKTTSAQYYRVDRREIAFIKFIFEAYDGIAMLTTIDPPKGIIALQVAPRCQEQVAEILQVLKKQVMIEPLTALPVKRN